MVTYIYDGEGYYATALESLSITDEIEEARSFEDTLDVTSQATLKDTIGFDIIINTVEDPGYLVSLTTATEIKGLNDVKIITKTATNNVMCVSEKFFWEIHKTTGEVLNKQFLYPNLGTIIDSKVYNNSLYILHCVSIPEVFFEVCTDNLVSKDQALIRGNTYKYTPVWTASPPPEWVHHLEPEHTIYKISKYSLETGEEEVSFEYQIDIATHRNSNRFVVPTNMVIYNNHILIVDKGSASIKSFDATTGVSEGILIDNDLLYSPFLIIVEDSDYVWVLDTARNTFINNYELKKINVTTNTIHSMQGFKEVPYIDLLILQNSFDLFLVTRKGSTYELYKNGIKDILGTAALNLHSLQSIVVTSDNYLFSLNRNPTDIRLMNLSTRSAINLRECSSPITITDQLPQEDTTIVLDSGLREVGIYQLYGEKDSVILDKVIPRGITKIGSTLFITNIQNSTISKLNDDGLTVIKNSEFAKITEIATDGEYLYVMDSGNNTIFKMTTDGEVILKIGRQGIEGGEFRYPISLSITNEKIYVLDAGNFRVQVLTLDGIFLKEFYLSKYQAPIILNKTISVGLAEIEDDAYETYNGVLQKYGDIKTWSFAGFQFVLPISKLSKITNASLSLYCVTPGIPRAFIYAEKTYNVLPYEEIEQNKPIFADRDKTITYLDWTGPSFPGGRSRTTADLSNIVQEVLDFGWTNNKISFIFQSYGTNPTIRERSAVLSVSYEETIPLRRKGLFHHLITDTKNIYVTDIANNLMIVYDINTFDLVDTIDFSGISMRLLSPNIFITNESCDISFTNKFKWGVEHSYSFESSVLTEEFLFNFEPEYQIATTVSFESLFVPEAEDTFEWVELSEMLLTLEEGFDLVFPETVWVL